MFNKALIAIAATVLTLGANAQTSWSEQRIGDMTFGSDSEGNTWSEQRIGDMTFGSGSKGNTWSEQRIGDE